MRDTSLQAAVRRYYEDAGVVAGYASIAVEGLTPFEEALLRRAFAPGQLILDVGCGGGREAVPMVQAGLRVVAIDLTVPMLRAVAAHAATCQVTLSALAGNVTVLPFRDQTFDGVAMLGQILALVPTRAQRLAALQSVRRVLRPGGTLVMTTHNRRCHWKFRLYFAWVNGWRRLARRLGRRGGPEDYDRWSRRDLAARPDSGQRLFLHMYDLQEAVADLQEAGFRVVEAKARAEFESGEDDPARRRRDYLLGFLARRQGDSPE